MMSCSLSESFCWSWSYYSRRKAESRQ